MNETIEKLKTVVDNLNKKLWGEYGENEQNSCSAFSFTYSTTIQFIGFDDETLWDSNDEERSFDYDKDDYEDLEKFVVKKFCEKGNKYLVINKLLKTKKHGSKI